MAEVETKLTTREIYTLTLLCIINVINYMDRYGTAGILVKIQKEFNITNELAGILQSALMVAYLTSAPVFGYLGDRYSRRYLNLACTTIWSLMLLLGSFSNVYWQFLVCRSVMGIFLSGFSTIAPAVISDIVVENMRTSIYAIFNVAIPLGAGLGYMCSAGMADLMDSWRWGLRLTPILNCVLTILLYFGVDPKRGAKELNAEQELKSTSYKDDVLYILRNKTFILSTAGLTCVTFVAGALAWWAPTALFYGFKLIPNAKDIELSAIMFIFGAITVATGILGAITGSGLSLLLRRHYAQADPLICCFGNLLTVPLLIGAFFCIPHNKTATYALITLGEWTMNVTWPVVMDILMYVVIPTRRSTALALQIFVIHGFGDLWSPSIVGALSEVYRKQNYVRTCGSTLQEPSDRKDCSDFYSLQLATLFIVSVHFIGVLTFLLCSVFVERDRQTAEELTAAAQ